MVLADRSLAALRTAPIACDRRSGHVQLAVAVAVGIDLEQL
jgi:hypothetical protein